MTEHATAEQILALVNRAKAEIAELKATGTSRMSRTGVKWSLEVTRARLARLRQWHKEVYRAERKLAHDHHELHGKLIQDTPIGDFRVRGGGR